jgi:hypothetical protein
VILTPQFWTSEGYWYLDVEVVGTPAREGTMGPILARSWLPPAPDGSSFGPDPGTLLARHMLLNQRFADAWRVKDTTSLFDYAPGTSTASFTDTNYPPEPGNPCTSPIGITHRSKQPLSADTARRACSDVAREARESCIFDVMVMDDTTVAKNYLRTVGLRQAATAPPP